MGAAELSLYNSLLYTALGTLSGEPCCKKEPTGPKQNERFGVSKLHNPMKPAERLYKNLLLLAVSFLNANKEVQVIFAAPILMPQGGKKKQRCLAFWSPTRTSVTG